METIYRCPECGSLKVTPAYDAMEDRYGLCSCESCEYLDDEEKFIKVV